MSEALLRYREFQRQLQYVRWKNRGQESREEDALLEEMDDAWWSMEEDERVRVNAEPPRALIRREHTPHRALRDVDVLTHPDRPHIRHGDAA